MLYRKYKKEDAPEIIRIILLEGDDWKDYSAPDRVDHYISALEKSITYVAEDKGEICGFSRSVFDNALTIMVMDLLVTPKYRGNKIGIQLMKCIYDDHPDIRVFVTTDIDEYYLKGGCIKAGSCFEVPKRHP